MDRNSFWDSPKVFSRRMGMPLTIRSGDRRWFTRAAAGMWSLLPTRPKKE
jgi:hypothetical protein